MRGSSDRPIYCPDVFETILLVSKVPTFLQLSSDNGLLRTLMSGLRPQTNRKWFRLVVATSLGEVWWAGTRVAAVPCGMRLLSTEFTFLY